VETNNSSAGAENSPTHYVEDDTPHEILGDSSTPESRKAAIEIGFGLQAADGLVPSDYAYEVARDYIEGSLNYTQAEQAILSHYQTQPGAGTLGRSKETDISALRIADIIQEPGFKMSPGYLRYIHERIFDGIFADRSWIGRWRNVELTKSEHVIGGKSVNYMPYRSIVSTLEYDFETERAKPFDPNSTSEDIAIRVMSFVSSIWQIHPFRVGNTRTCATFAIKYLNDLGVNVDNSPFSRNAAFLRDALVLDNAPTMLQDPVPLKLFAKSLVDAAIHLPDLRSSYPKTQIAPPNRHEV